LEKEQPLLAADITWTPSGVLRSWIKCPRFDILILHNIVIIIRGKDMAKELEPFRSVDAV